MKTYKKYEVSLFKLAENLHMRKTGSAEPYADLALAAYWHICERLESWEEGLYWSKKYDDAVKNLLQVVCQEYYDSCYEQDREDLDRWQFMMGL